MSTPIAAGGMPARAEPDAATVGGMLAGSRILPIALADRPAFARLLADAPAHRAARARLPDDLCIHSESRDIHGMSLTLRFLNEWLLRHTDTDDRRLTAAFAVAGVA